MQPRSNGSFHSPPSCAPARPFACTAATGDPSKESGKDAKKTNRDRRLAEPDHARGGDRRQGPPHPPPSTRCRSSTSRRPALSPGCVRRSTMPAGRRSRRW